jgi:hypothetical protein
MNASGGGATLTGTYDGHEAITSSYPNTGTSWTATASADATGAAASQTLNVYVICG